MDETDLNKILRRQLVELLDVNEALVSRVEQLKSYINRGGLEVPAIEAGMTAPVVEIERLSNSRAPKRQRTSVSGSYLNLPSAHESMAWDMLEHSIANSVREAITKGPLFMGDEFAEEEEQEDVQDYGAPSRLQSPSRSEIVDETTPRSRNSRVSTSGGRPSSSRFSSNDRLSSGSSTGSGSRLSNGGRVGNGRLSGAGYRTANTSFRVPLKRQSEPPRTVQATPAEARRRSEPARTEVSRRSSVRNPTPRRESTLREEDGEARASESFRDSTDYSRGNLSELPAHEPSRRLSQQSREQTSRRFSEQPSEQPTGQQRSERMSEHFDEQTGEQTSEQRSEQFTEQHSEQIDEQIHEQVSEHPSADISGDMDAELNEELDAELDDELDAEFEQPLEDTRQESEEHAEQQAEQHAEQHAEQYAEQHSEQHSEQHVEQPVEQHAEKHAKHAEQQEEQPQYDEQASQMNDHTSDHSEEPSLQPSLNGHSSRNEIDASQQRNSQILEPSQSEHFTVESSRDMSQTSLHKQSSPQKQNSVREQSSVREQTEDSRVDESEQFPSLKLSRDTSFFGTDDTSYNQSETLQSIKLPVSRESEKQSDTSRRQSESAGQESLSFRPNTSREMAQSILGSRARSADDANESLKSIQEMVAKVASPEAIKGTPGNPPREKLYRFSEPPVPAQQTRQQTTSQQQRPNSSRYSEPMPALPSSIMRTFDKIQSGRSSIRLPVTNFAPEQTNGTPQEQQYSSPQRSSPQRSSPQRSSPQRSSPQRTPRNSERRSSEIEPSTAHQSGPAGTSTPAVSQRNRSITRDSTSRESIARDSSVRNSIARDSTMDTTLYQSALSSLGGGDHTNNTNDTPSRSVTFRLPSNQSMSSNTSTETVKLGGNTSATRNSPRLPRLPSAESSRLNIPGAWPKTPSAHTSFENPKQQEQQQQPQPQPARRRRLNSRNVYEVDDSQASLPDMSEMKVNPEDISEIRGRPRSLQ